MSRNTSPRLGWTDGCWEQFRNAPPGRAWRFLRKDTRLVPHFRKSEAAMPWASLVRIRLSASSAQSSGATYCPGGLRRMVRTPRLAKSPPALPKSSLPKIGVMVETDAKTCGRFVTSPARPDNGQDVNAAKATRNRSQLVFPEHRPAPIH